MNKSVILLPLIILFLFSCKQQAEKKQTEITVPKRQEPKTIAYQFANGKAWLLEHKTDSLHKAIAFAVNRTDIANFASMDQLLLR
jgi:uncharacterized lipoprotein NlpE involved in copper resistance